MKRKLKKAVSKKKADNKASDRKHWAAEANLSPFFRNVVTNIAFVNSATGAGDEKIDLFEAGTVMIEKIAKVKDGDLSDTKAILMAQASTLDSIFTELARRASYNIGEGHPLKIAEIYLRLALKAQSQSRCTLEALAEIVNPRPVAFVKQANIASGPQQVNNSPSDLPASDNGARGGKFINQSNELLGVTNVQRVDTRTSETAIAANQELATLEQINRTKD